MGVASVRRRGRIDRSIADRGHLTIVDADSPSKRLDHATNPSLYAHNPPASGDGRLWFTTDLDDS